MSIPPLSQSRQSLLACPASYVEQVIRKNRGPASEASARGTEIHSFLKRYTAVLCYMKAGHSDVAFDGQSKGMPPDALALIEPLRATFRIDPDKIVGAEHYIALGEDFEPVQNSVGGIVGAEKHYEMTLDLITLEDDRIAMIDDYKSNFKAFEADTFQAKLYSLGLLMLNRTLEKVTFRLHFVRWNRERTQTFTREDVPALQTEARQWREMQLRLHAVYDDAAGPTPIALPGSHCVYCPLLAQGCPIEKNPYGGPEGNLLNVLYFRQALKRAEEAVRAEADKTGPITVKDNLGTEYVAGWGIREKKKFSLDALPALLAWCKAKREDLLPKLSISGLSSLLKAKKRAALADAMANFCEVHTESVFRVGKAKEEEDEPDAE